MSIGLNDTIQQGKTWLLARLDKGSTCPLCNQHAQLYRRKITSGMAGSLIRMYRTAGQGWIHVSLIGGRSRDHAMLAYWGLIEEQQGKGLHGGRAGYWRVTQRGEAFIVKGLKVPKYAAVYNGKVHKLDGDPISIKDALGTKFNYDDLMNGV